MQHTEIWCVSRKSMFQNQPEAIKKQERFLHTKMILNITFKKTGDETQKSNFAKENLLFTCHAAKVEFSPTTVSSIITWNNNLRLGKRVCVWQLLSSGPLNVPSPCCWHSSFGWSLQMSSLPCTKTLKASSLQWKALYPLYIFYAVLSWVASNNFTFHMRHLRI